MDVDSSSSLPHDSLPIPRLRLSRNPHSHAVEPQPPQPAAGPSRITEGDAHIDLNLGDDDDSLLPTPRAKMTSDLPSSPTPDMSPDTPAARLRAVLSRVANTPNHDATPRPPVPSSPSILESDFDTPTTKPATPSIARDTLKDLFSRARRDPGGSPEKSRPRRNSIDTSEVEASPRVMDRSRDKGKRRSLSDEEVENYSRLPRVGNLLNDFTPLNNLREKLSDSTPSNSPTIQARTSHDSNGQMLSISRDFSASQVTPPLATSTPQRSLLIPLSSSQSNLLEQDSEMNRALVGLESDAENSGFHKPESLINPHEHFNKSFQNSIYRVRVTSEPKTSDYRSISRQSSLRRSFSQLASNNEQDSVQERELEWNKRNAKTRSGTPDLKRQNSRNSILRNHSPILITSPHRASLSRRSSISSLQSHEDASSSGASSLSSRSEYSERRREAERERNKERERDWNKPHPKHSRPSSSLEMHSPAQRKRTLSSSGRPLSFQNMESFDHQNHTLKKRDSFSSARTISPHGSVDSEGSAMPEVDHERERNWNSPRPQWHHRSPSQISTGGHREPNAPDLPSHLDPLMRYPHARSDSPSMRSHQTSLPFALSNNPSGQSSSQHNQPPHDNSHSNDPFDLKPSTPEPFLRAGQLRAGETTAVSPSQSYSRSGFLFPRSQTPILQTALDMDPSGQPKRSNKDYFHRSPSPASGSRPSSRASGHASVSRIPVMKNSQFPTSKPSPLERGPIIDGSNLDKNGDIERLDASLPTPPGDSDGEEEQAASEEATPVLRAIAPPPMDEVHVPVSSQSTVVTDRRRNVAQDETRLQKALASAPAVVQEASPPLSPVVEGPISTSVSSSVLATPPRRTSFQSSTIQFQTPSPPKGLPDLPGPPSESELDSDSDALGFQSTPLKERPDGLLDMSSAKTPKPPGAWVATPLSQRTEMPAQTQTEHIEERRNGPQFSAGLATPASSISKAAVLAQTPAPPGAWAATPAPRKSILKVRFDTQNPAESSENGFTTGGVKTSQDIPDNVLESADDLRRAKKSSVTVTEVDDNTGSKPQSISSRPFRSHRKSASIRVLDAFGRYATTTVSGSEATGRVPAEQNSFKIVDAMGHEVYDGGEASVEDTSVLNHNEALARVRDGLADLAADMSDYDKSSLSSDESRLHELDSMARSARATREKLAECIATEHTIQSKIVQLRASMRRNKLQDILRDEYRQPWMYTTSWLLFSGVVLFFVLLIVVNRLADARAKELYMTAYYDPFNPELYNTAKPYSTGYQSHLRHTWSSLVMRESSDSFGWKALALDFWSSITTPVSEWNNWGDDSPTFTWPPT